MEAKQFKYKDYGKRVLHNTLTCVSHFLRPQSYLEIGVREGDSLRAVLDGYFPFKITLCDTWGSSFGGSGRGDHKHIEKLLEEEQYNFLVKFLDGDSKYMIPTLNEEFDLILVDGDHSYKGAYRDLKQTWRLLKKGGLLVFDDVTHRAHTYLYECVMSFADEVDGEIFYINLNDNGVVVLKK